LTFAQSQSSSYELVIAPSLNAFLFFLPPPDSQGTWMRFSALSFPRNLFSFFSLVAAFFRLGELSILLFSARGIAGFLLFVFRLLTVTWAFFESRLSVLKSPLLSPRRVNLTWLFWFSPCERSVSHREFSRPVLTPPRC